MFRCQAIGCAPHTQNDHTSFSEQILGRRLLPIAHSTPPTGDPGIFCNRYWSLLGILPPASPRSSAGQSNRLLGYSGHQALETICVNLLKLGETSAQ